MSTLSVDAIQGKTAAGTVAMPAGMVIQTATTLSIANNGTYSSQTLSHISTFDVAFTPKFSNSLVRVSWNGQVDLSTSGAANPWFSMSFFQDSTDLNNQTGLTYNGTNYQQFIVSSGGGTKYINFVDMFDAGSTSSRTYKIYIRVGSTDYSANLAMPSRRRMIVEEIQQ